MIRSLLQKLKYDGKGITHTGTLIRSASIRLQDDMRRWSQYMVGLTLVIAVLVLAGWQFDLTFLLAPFSSLVAMNPISALTFILCAVSFFLLTSDHPTSAKTRSGRTLAGLVIVIGILKLSGVVFGFETHVDTFLYHEKVQKEMAGVLTNLMTPNAAACFILIGLSLLLLKVELRNKQIPSQWLALITGLAALLSILGYLYRVQAFYGMLTYVPMAVHSALCFSLFSLAILFIYPDKGIMKELTGPFAGSITARVLIPAAIIIPTLFGMIRLKGVWTGVYSPEFGTAALVLGIIVIFLCFIWYTTSTLNKREIQNIESEIALRQSEEQIQTIFQFAPDAVIVIDIHGNVVKWNPKAESIFGWTSAEMAGKPLFRTIIPERFRLEHQKWMSNFAATGENPLMNKTAEIFAINKNGREFNCSLSLSPTIVRDGYLLIGFLRDITARKKAEAEIKQLNAELEKRVEEKTREFINSERRFRALIENSTDVIMMINEKKEVIYLSPSAERVTGLTVDDFEGKTALDFIHKDDARETVPFFQDLMRESSASKYRQLRLRNKEGHYLWTEGMFTNLLHDDSVQAVVFNFRDITERKNAELERGRMTAELIQHVKDLEQFAYIVSHNLRAPVANLMGICDVLESQQLSTDDRTTIMNGLSSSVKKLDNVIMDLSHILSVTHEINEKKEQVSLPKLLNDIKASISDVIKREQFEIKSDFTEAPELFTLKSYLYSIFYNLIMNSIKYRRNGVPPLIEISSRRINQNVELTFKDNGMGIDLSKRRDEVFGLYKRFHNNVEGKGLGLFMVKTHVETLGGQINIKSEVNQGTEFKIVFAA